jgi:hypothetical protein
MGRKGPGAGTQCDAGRWSEGKSGRGKREKTKKESKTRGESASLRTGRENEETKGRTTAVQPPKPKSAALGNVHGKTARLRLDSNQSRHIMPPSHINLVLRLRPELPISQIRRPSRMPRMLKTSTLLSSPRSPMPVSMPWRASGQLILLVSCSESGHQLRQLLQP